MVANVEVTGAARLYRAASVWTAGLERTRQLALAKLRITIAPSQIEARLRKRFHTIDKRGYLSDTHCCDECQKVAALRGWRVKGENKHDGRGSVKVASGE